MPQPKKGQAKQRESLVDRVRRENPNASDAELKQLIANARATEKRQRFLTVGTRRTRQTLKALEGLARVGNRNVYTYDDGEAAKILEAVRSKVEDVEHSFSGTHRESEEFSL